jgi:predicted RecB family nuclease
MFHKPTVTRFAQDRISASMFYKYDACPHWLYFDKYGDPAKKAPTTEFSDMLREGGVLHEKKIVSEMQCASPQGETTEEKFSSTLKLMRDGVQCIYHGVLVDDEFIGVPDLLERRDGIGSAFGAYHYVPVEIKNAERLSDAHKYQLCCYGELLRRIQGTSPEEGYVLNASGVRIGFALREFDEQFRNAVEEIRKTLAGTPPPPHLASSCKQSPWFKECVAFAETRDDIALLYNVKKKVVVALREYGIRTVHDAALIDVERLCKEDPLFKRALLERIVLQARALIEHRHFVRKPIDLPEAPLEIFFDIEGDPLRQAEYLFGFLVRKNGEEKYLCHLAEKPEDERRMWADFLAWLETLDNEYVVYHYGTYELTRIITLEARYGGSAKLNVFRDRLVDLNEIVKDAIVFPLYFYGIKDIGKYVGFVREGAIAGGGESVAFYEDWLKTGERATLDAIIEYNTEDVVATRYLKDWLAKERDAFREEHAE